MAEEDQNMNSNKGSLENEETTDIQKRIEEKIAEDEKSLKGEANYRKTERPCRTNGQPFLTSVH